MGIQIACQMTFVSIGNAPCSIIVAVLRKFVLLLPLIYLLPDVYKRQLQQRCMQTLRRGFRRRDRQAAGRTTRRVMSRVAVAGLAAVLRCV